MIIVLYQVSTGIYLWKLWTFFLLDPNALTETVTPVVVGHWLKEKPASGPRGCWEPNESKHNLWAFPEGKTEALYEFIVCHYSQPADYVTVVQNSVTGETQNIHCIIQHQGWASEAILRTIKNIDSHYLVLTSLALGASSMAFSHFETTPTRRRIGQFCFPWVTFKWWAAKNGPFYPMIPVRW